MTDEPTQRCETCGEEIPASRYPLHASGLDGARPECPLTDLVEIAQRARPSVYGGSEWDALRARFQGNHQVPVRSAG